MRGFLPFTPYAWFFCYLTKPFGGTVYCFFKCFTKVKLTIIDKFLIDNKKEYGIEELLFFDEKKTTLDS